MLITTNPDCNVKHSKYNGYKLFLGAIIIIKGK